MARLYFETYGCQMNEADTRYIAERAIAQGYQIVPKAEEAEVLILNTCTVRDSAEKRAYGRLGAFKMLKQQNPRLRILVCGCLAEQDRDVMLGRVPFVDALFGTHELPALADRLGEWFNDFEGSVEYLETRALLAPLGAPTDGLRNAFTPLRAFVNVQYGCSYYCTYCIVPHVRGRFAHRPLSEIVQEIQARIAEGAREITLVGQTVNAYSDPETALDFAGLLRHVAALTGLERLAFITSHPNDLTEGLLRAFQEIPQLNPRLHLALQSGSNPILKRMNRKYTIEAYLDKIAAFRRACPHWALTSDIIVGFPGETEEDFVQTLKIVDQMQFAQVYSFAYSPRRGTPAAQWDPVPAEIANERLRRLLDQVNIGVQAYHGKKVGTRVRALVQGASRKDPHKLAAKALDNVTIVASIEGDAERFAATPWLEVSLERAHLWGCYGALVGVAERYDGPLVPIPAGSTAKPLIDLIVG